MRHLEDIIADLDRRIARGRARITRSANAKVQGDEEVTSERLGRINSQINNTLTQVRVYTLGRWCLYCIVCSVGGAGS